MNNLNLIGKKFNKLTVLERSSIKSRNVVWKCRCDCGNITFVETCNLKANRVKSCGCLKLEKFIERSTKHNQRHTKLYEVWKSIKQRCLNPNNRSYKNYGLRGISICDEWKNDFNTFYTWSMKNGYNSKLSIDRINNNGNYEPSNCRWVDRTTQANNKRTNHFITYDNKTLTIAQWSQETGISPCAIYCRLQRGWSPEKTLTTPISK